MRADNHRSPCATGAEAEGSDFDVGGPTKTRHQIQVEGRCDPATLRTSVDFHRRMNSSFDRICPLQRWELHFLATVPFVFATDHNAS